MHTNIKSIQLSDTFYIQAPRRRCDDKVNSRFLPFASRLVSNSLEYTTASSAQKNQNTKLDF